MLFKNNHTTESRDRSRKNISSFVDGVLRGLGPKGDGVREDVREVPSSHRGKGGQS